MAINNTQTFLIDSFLFKIWLLAINIFVLLVFGTDLVLCSHVNTIIFLRMSKPSQKFIQLSNLKFTAQALETKTSSHLWLISGFVHNNNQPMLLEKFAGHISSVLLGENWTELKFLENKHSIYEGNWLIFDSNLSSFDNATLHRWLNNNLQIKS
ncbi:MAG: hypothetical protein V4629_08420 [Pseudomonadota bacterium]